MTTGPNEQLRLNAFVDGELELEQQLAIEEQLRHDTALRAQVERLRATRDAIRERARYHAAPADLRGRVDAMLAPAKPRVVARPAWTRWSPWAAATAFAAVAMVSANVWLVSLHEDERIEGDVVASHVRATLGERQVDVASSNHHTVKPWLSAKLDFSPPVHELSGPGSALLGGRVDYVGGRPVAVLAYRHAGHAADEFVWPSKERERGVAMTSDRGFNIAHWTRAGMTHWLVSDLNAAELRQLADSLDNAD
jgi:anti-sigma factor RsiW